MDFYADMPMPSIEERVATLITFIENPTNNHVAIATQVASETKTFEEMCGDSVWCSKLSNSEKEYSFKNIYFVLQKKV